MFKRFLNSYSKQLKILKQNLNKGDVVVDIGAREGQFTLLASKIVGAEGQVYAIEPEKENYKQLKEKTKGLNYVNVKVIQAIASAETEQAAIYSGKDSFYNTAYKTSENQNFQMVLAIKIDELEPQEKKDLIIIDVCGSEAKIIKGMAETMKRNPQLKIMMDFSPDRIKKAGDSPEQLLNILEERGYKFYQIMGGLFQDLQQKSKEELLKDNETKWLMIKKTY